MHPYRLYSSFFIIAGAFALLMVLILITLLVKHKDVGKSQALTSLKYFILCFFGIILLYYYESFMGIYTGIFERSVLSRAADFALVIVMQYFWFAFVRTHLYAAGHGRKTFDKSVNILLAFLLVVSVFDSIALIDVNYYAANPASRIFAIAVEVVLCITCCGLNLFYMADSVRAKIQNRTRNFIIVTSLLLFVSALHNEVVTIRLMAGKMSYIVESFYYDPTSLIMICTAISMLIYLFKHDFSPIYFHEREISDEEVLDHLAAEYGLSKREAEIAQLIFRGDSYEDIAENLVISRLTVKKHVHNFYEKLDVAKRMDLINLVRDEKDRLQQNRP